MTFRIFVLAVLVANLSESNGQSTISPYLQEQIQKSTGTQATKIQVYMSKKVDLLALTQSFNERRLTMDQRSFELITALKQVADESQESILKHVDRWNSNHSQKAEVLKQFYIVNLMVINAPIELINQLDLLSGIETIEAYDRYTFKYQAPVMKNPSNSREAGGHEPGLEAIHAPFMWRLGYTGLGRKLYTVDTGIWHTHPAISRQWQGNYLPQDWCWKGIDSPDPKDKPGSHGTHVTGTVLGLDSQTADTVGVAFNATFIVSDPIVESVSEVKPIPEVFESYEFALNPDGNPATSSDIPDVICNSWGRGDIVDLSICDQPFIISMFQALDVLGVAVEFSAGNEGPAPGTAGLPAYAAFDSLTIFSVGAVDGNNPSFPIADFSSRGPTPCDVSEELKIKPEVCAPGYNVRSSVSLTDYAFYSGTSMAGPHVAGAVLLLKEAFPFLTGRDLLNALYQTADDLGEPGEDNNYGRGIINLESAYNFLLQSHTPVPPNSSTEDMLLESILIPEDICTVKTATTFRKCCIATNNIASI
jgi:bacillopeptidase F